MKQTSMLLLAALLGAPVAQAQTPATTPAKATRQGTSRLTGTVVDATTQKPVEYATVTLLPATGRRGRL